MGLLLHHQCHQMEMTWGMAWGRGEVQWSQQRIYEGHVGGVRVEEHVGVGWEAVGVGGVGSGDEVNPRGVCVEFEG